MEKAIGQEYQGSQRIQFLQDNSEGREEISYMRRFTPDEIAGFKDHLSEVAIQMNDIEEAKAEAMKAFKDELEPLKEEKKELLSNLKNKARLTKEKCFKLIDQQEGRVGYYNSEGILVEERPIKPEERQLTFKIGATGTDY